MENRYQRDINKKSRGPRTAKIPWGLMALAFVFLFNPNISVLDVLPDFFGYIILSLALLKVSMLCEGLAEARRAFERLILVDGAKILAMALTRGAIRRAISSDFLCAILLGTSSPNTRVKKERISVIKTTQMLWRRLSGMAVMPQVSLTRLTSIPAKLSAANALPKNPERVIAT